MGSLRLRVGDMLSGASAAPSLDVEESVTVEKALSILEVHSILSIPVFSRSLGGLSKMGFDRIIGAKRYLGIVSVLDLAAFLLPAMQRGTVSLSGKLGEPVVAALGCSGTSESGLLWVKSADAPLLELLELFSKGVHRVLITPSLTPPATPLCAQLSAPPSISPSTSHSASTHTLPSISSSALPHTAGGLPVGETAGGVIGAASSGGGAACGAGEAAGSVGSCIIVSQTDAVRFLLHQPHRGVLACLNQPMAALHYDAAESAAGAANDSELHLVSLSESLSVVAALRHMLQFMVTAVPVVDGRGRLLAQFSTSDLRGLKASEADAFVRCGSLGSFIRSANNGCLRRALSCTAEDTLSTVLGSMLEARVHHTWYIDALQVVQGVFTFTDFLAMIYERERASTIPARMIYELEQG